MIRPLLLLASAAALGLAAPSVAQAPGDTAAIRAAAAAFDAAQQKGDRAALEALIAPDFLFVRASGRIGDKHDFIDGFAAPGNRLEPFHIEDPLLIRASADVAIVGGEAWLKGVADGKPFAEHFRYSDTFALRGGKWVAIYTQVTGLPAQ